jgi:hypothetical protein
MRLSEVKEKTGLGKHALQYLYDNVLHVNEKKIKKAHRVFTQSDVDYIKNIQLGVFDKKHKLVKVPNFDLYWVSPEGEIFTYLKGYFEPFKVFQSKNGYGYVNLYDRKEKKHKTFRFHRLIATIFIPNPKNKLTVNHKDGNKMNNNIHNLEWATMSENTQHAFDNELAKNAKGEEDSQSYPIDVCYQNGKIVHFGSCSEAERKTSISCSLFLRHAKNGTTSTKYGFTVKFVQKKKCND